MKTLYININNEEIQSDEKLEVLKHELDSDFFFYLGEKIAKGCNVENENALITDFNTQDNEEEYKLIIAQWNELKAILFSEECEGEFEFTLPDGYIHWLKFHPQYVAVYDRNFSHGKPITITIDLEELYEDSVENLQGKILYKLQRNDLCLEIDEIVFNDDTVTHKSPIVRTTKEKYKGISFKSYKKWLQENEERLSVCKKCGKSPCECISHVPENILSLENIELGKNRNSQEKLIISCDSIENRYNLVLKYRYIKNFDSENLIVVSNFNHKYGFIDKIGQEIIPCIYEYCFSFKEGVSLVKLNGKWGLIDKTGRTVIPIKYDGADDFSEGLAIVMRNGKEGFIDTTGKEIIPCVYELCLHFKEGLAIVKLNGKQGVIDTTGRAVIPIKYDNVYSFSEGLASVKRKGKWGLKDKWGFIDKTGKEVIPIKYDDAYSFREGLASVKHNGKWGFIDTTGRAVIPIKYDAAVYFSEGLASVELNNKCGFIDRTGKEVIPFEYDRADDFNEGLAKVELNNKCGFIDRTGKEVIPFEYDVAWPFQEGLAKVKLNNKWGFIDKKNLIIIPLVFDEVEYIKTLDLIKTEDKNSKRIFVYNRQGILIASSE